MWMYAFISLGYIPRIGIARSYSNSMPNSLPISLDKLVIFYYLESYGISPRALLILSWFWLICKVVSLAFPLI